MLCLNIAHWKNVKPLSHVIVGNEAFLFPGKRLTEDKTVFNFRPLRARWDRRILSEFELFLNKFFQRMQIKNRKKYFEICFYIFLFLELPLLFPASVFSFSPKSPCIVCYDLCFIWWNRCRDWLKLLITMEQNYSANLQSQYSQLLQSMWENDRRDWSDQVRNSEMQIAQVPTQESGSYYNLYNL